MNIIEKFDSNQIQRSPAEFEMPPLSESGDTSFLIAALLRRWQIAALILGAAVLVGVPVIWLMMEPKYDITGAIRVAPILPNILTGDPQRGEISNYQSFMNTQAKMIVSTQIIQKVADDLAGKHLAFFENQSEGIGAKLIQKMSGGKLKPDPVNILKQAVYNEVITAVATHNNELVEITMTSDNPEEAKKIVDAFIHAYMLVEVSNSLQGQDQTLTLLENERKILSEKLENQQNAIQQMAQEYGTDTLTERQSVMLNRVSNLLTELTKVESERISCEARIQVLEEGKGLGVPVELMTKRNERINSDPTIQELSRNLVRLDQELIEAKQVMTPENPMLKQKEEFIATFKRHLEDRRKELSRDFEAMTAEEVNVAAKNELLIAKGQLQQYLGHENRLREVLAKEDSQTVQIGRKELAMNQMKEKLASMKEMYDTIGKRIQTLEMERKQPARVSVAYEADITHIADKRVKYTLALMFCAMVCGLGGVMARDKIDRSLHTPDEVTKLIGIRIIGTTTAHKTIRQDHLLKQIAEDYQTIRANLGLLDERGMPKTLVITSPGMRDGKTTFSINLATSEAKAGKKVLLIDGDLRKPDIGRLLNVPKDARLLQDVLSGKILKKAVFIVPSSGLHVLAADSGSREDPYELLAAHQAAENIDFVSQSYDHVIIDTPPLLAFPDALLWAKMAGSVILSGFAGRTTSFDLKEAKQRLSEMGVRILGTVLSNVPVEHAYYRYGYSYYTSSISKNQKPNRPLLLPPDNPDICKKPYGPVS